MKRIQTWWVNSSQTVRLVILILLGGAILPSLLGLVAGASFSDLLLNFGTQMAGALVTFLLIEGLLRDEFTRSESAQAAEQPDEDEDEAVIAIHETQEEARATAAMKDILIADLGSKTLEVSRQAAEGLRRRGWLTDGSLQGVRLRHANLQELDLVDANLQVAFLVGANLQGADLRIAKLQVADLVDANLRSANLKFAKLQGANLGFADLQDASLEAANLLKANLWGTKLQAVNLNKANLQAADLAAATFDEMTVLPDGTQWTSDTDMRQFTDPEHPDFWRSDEPDSPAYRGNET